MRAACAEHRACEVLASLPGAALPGPAAFRAAACEGLAAGLLKPSSLECSVGLGEASFRALVALGPERARDRRGKLLARSFAGALELPRAVVDAALFWLQDDEYEAYFGLAQSRSERRRKAYFRSIAEREADFAPLLRRLGFPRLGAKPARCAGLSMLAVDYADGKAVGWKAYWRAEARPAAAFRQGELARLVASAARPPAQACLCRRYDGAGRVADESWHVGLAPEEAGAAAQRYAGSLGDLRGAALLRRLGSELSVRVTMLSEIARPPAHRIYFCPTA